MRGFDGNDALDEVLGQRLGATGKNSPTRNYLDPKFPHQAKFVADRSKLKVLHCTRRAAKSYSMGLELVRDADETPGCNCLYLGLTKDAARRIMWKDVLKDINRRHGLNAEFNETRLTMTLPNESVIYLSAADADEEEMDKLLGLKYKKVAIDEGQSWHVDMRRLIYGVLFPATADYRGTITLAGTAGNITQGLFYELTRQDIPTTEPGWAHYSWTAYDNPYISEQWAAEIEEIKRTRPLFLQTALYKQWYLNQWVIDTNKLVYWYKQGRNDYQNLPHFSRGDWQHVLGVDLGYSPDPSAFAVAAFHEHDKTLFGREAYKKTEMDITDVANKIKEYQNRFPIFKVIIDGSNKQAVQEMQRRHDVALTAADKRGKTDFISLMNAEFVQEQIKVQPVACEPLVTEWGKLVWKTEGDKIILPREEHPGLPNHCSDAFLYAWRYCYQFLSKAPPKPVDLNNREEFIRHTEKLMEENLERQIQAEKAEENDEDFWAVSAMDNDDGQDVLRHYLNKKRRR